MSAGRKIAGGTGGSSGGGGGAGSGTDLTPLLDTLRKEMQNTTDGVVSGGPVVTDWIDIRGLDNIGLTLKWTIMGGTISSGLRSYHTVVAATVAPLPACTPSGTGASHILTANANGAFPTIDGQVIVVNPNLPILVKNQAAQDDNGMYYLLDAGSAGTPWILARSSDFNSVSAFEVTYGAYIFNAGGGTVNASRPFVVTSSPVIMDTDPIIFANGDPFGTFYIDVSNDKVIYTPLTITFDSPSGANYAPGGLPISGVPSPTNAYNIEGLDLNQLPWAYFRLRYVPDVVNPTNGWLTVQGFGKDI